MDISYMKSVDVETLFLISLDDYKIHKPHMRIEVIMV
tara:strand:- start:503 stop:613 length:111 start_codon:yes stop_codon:yes gene_type:complete